MRMNELTAGDVFRLGMYPKVFEVLDVTRGSTTTQMMIKGYSKYREDYKTLVSIITFKNKDLEKEVELDGMYTKLSRIEVGQRFVYPDTMKGYYELKQKTILDKAVEYTLEREGEKNEFRMLLRKTEDRAVLLVSE